MDESQHEEVLAAECHVFCQYLLGQPAPPDVVGAYRRAHDVGDVAGGGAPSALDTALLRVARAGPGRARGADTYAAVFARTSLLRRKLVLLVAILESREPTAAALDTAVPGSPAAWILGVVVRVAMFVLRLGAATPVIGALWVSYAIRNCVRDR